MMFSISSTGTTTQLTGPIMACMLRSFATELSDVVLWYLPGDILGVIGKYGTTDKTKLIRAVRAECKR
jgi:hypothetical protein